MALIDITIPQSVFSFLLELKKNNNREWMLHNKKRYLEGEKVLKNFYAAVEADLNKTDQIEKVKVFRINRDIRFSNDKTPYNIHRSASFSRAGDNRRGGYYLRLEPGNSRLAGGFFEPNSADLLRIRKEFEMDSTEIRTILSEPEFHKSFGGFDQQYAVKTAPKNFSKDDLNIDLIRLKNFFVNRSFTDKEVFSPHFKDYVVHHFNLLRPFFDYMTEILTTDLNGEKII